MPPPPPPTTTTRPTWTRRPREARGSEGGGGGRGRRRRRQRRRHARPSALPLRLRRSYTSNNERRAADAAAAAAAAAAAVAGARAEATRLYARNDPVSLRTSSGSKLQGRPYLYHAMDGGRLASQMDNCIAPKELRLKVGAQVMLLKNLAPSAASSTARVGSWWASPARRIGFDQLLVGYPAEGIDLTCPTCRRSSSSPQTAYRATVPSTWRWSLGWYDKVARALLAGVAISIHKSQGMTSRRRARSLASSPATPTSHVSRRLAGGRRLSFDPSRLRVPRSSPLRAPRRRRRRAAAAAHAPRRRRRRRRRTLGGAASADRGEQAAALARRQQALGRQTQLAP